MRWRAAPGHLAIVPLDAFTAVYQRPSGQTHLLVEPAPQILDMLTESLSEAELLQRLSATYDVENAEALAERIRELAEAGLIARA